MAVVAPGKVILLQFVKGRAEFHPVRFIEAQSFIRLHPPQQFDDRERRQVRWQAVSRSGSFRRMNFATQQPSRRDNQTNAHPAAAHTNPAAG